MIINAEQITRPSAPRLGQHAQGVLRVALGELDTVAMPTFCAHQHERAHYECSRSIMEDWPAETVTVTCQHAVLQTGFDRWIAPRSTPGHAHGDRVARLAAATSSGNQHLVNGPSMHELSKREFSAIHHRVAVNS
jgi:hypothetical protein